MRKRFAKLSTLLLAVFVIAVCSTTYGQATRDSARVVQPEAIPLIEISEQTEDLRNEINLTRQRLLPDERLDEIEADFESEAEMFQQEVDEYLEFRKVTPNKQKLDNQIRKWKRIADTRTRWRSDVGTFLGRSKTSLEIMEFNKQVWELTLNQQGIAAAPQSLTFSVQNTIDSLDRLIGDITDRMRFGLDLNAHITEQREEALRIVDDLEEWSTSGELNVFYKRHNAIWNTSFRSEDRVARKARLESMEDHLGSLADYYGNFSWQVYVFLIIVIVLVIFITYLKKKMETLNLENSERRLVLAHEVVQKYTVITVIYLSCMIALFYLGRLPVIMTQIFTVGILVASFILFKEYTHGHFRRIIIFLVVAFIMDQAKAYIWFSSAGYRIYLYTEAVFALGVLWYYFIPKSKLSGMRDTALNRVFYYGASALILLNVICFMANTLGYTNLADVMLQISVQGSVITVIAYGIFVVFGGIVSSAVSLYLTEEAGITYQASETIKKRTEKIVKWLALLIWVTFLLSSAELYRPLFKSLELWLTEPWTVGEFSITPGNILSFILVIVVTIIITRTIALIVDGGVLGFLRIQQGTLNAMSMVIRYTVVVFAITIALGSLGIDMTKFGFVAGALGVGIGFGLQNIVANFIAGMILTFERPIEPGDTVEVNGKMGVVQKIGVRSSVLRGFDGSDVVIPNNTLLSNDLINWTKSDHQKRVEISIGTAYGTDPREVREILLDVARSTVGVEKEPEPIVWFTEFGDSSLNFKLLFWTSVDMALGIRSEIAGTIYDRFEKAGIEIPFPRRDITIRSEDGPDNPDDAER